VGVITSIDSWQLGEVQVDKTTNRQFVFRVLDGGSGGQASFYARGWKFDIATDWTQVTV